MASLIHGNNPIFKDEPGEENEKSLGKHHLNMKDSHKLTSGYTMWMILIVADVVLLMAEIIGAGVFTVILIVAMAMIVVPSFFFKGTQIELDTDSMHITAPFVNLDIPYSSITSASYVGSMPAGTRGFGYGGIRYSSGDFSNKPLGGYIRSVDTRVPLIIILKAPKKTVAFNMKTLEETKDVLEELRWRIPCQITGTVPETEPSERGPLMGKKGTIAIISSLVVVALVASSLSFVGHITVSLEEDSLEIDATMMSESVDYDDITYIELRTDMDYGSRVGGLANGKVMTGNFENNEFGRYRLAAWCSVDTCIVIHTTGKTVVFNLEDDGSTEEFYDALNGKLGRTMPSPAV